MENQTCGPLYLCSKHQTHPFVPELWILASFPNQYHVKDNRANSTARAIIIRGDNKNNSTLNAMAICHCGPGTEAGSGTCYVKFGAVRPSQDSSAYFDHLLAVCESFAKSQQLSRVSAGVNLGRHNAYRKMIEHRFRTDLQGVAMHKPNEAGYNNENVYVIDDWR